MTIMNIIVKLRLIVACMLLVLACLFA